MAGNIVDDIDDSTVDDTVGGDSGDRPVRMADGYFPVETLGPGRRLVLWFQGCALACPGCMSRHTWDPAGGRPVTVGELLRLWDAALARGAEGLTVSGGEPLAQPAALAALLRGADRVRRRHGRPADLLVYTGHEPQEVPADVWSALTDADAVITGRFRVAEPTDLVWRGSANQRLVPRTALGARRYGPHLSRTYPPGPRVSLRVEAAGAVSGSRAGDGGPAGAGAASAAGGGAGAGAGAWVYGVPARGELRLLELGLAADGIRLRGPSWRA
ncbi:4Fe-4S single cluster domain-containing protein [Streptomyces sp. NPDC088812]|uniref:4Fe-4S single cluster domain-containing protein n=1 Tax=Streptomyces sp. NPDC088812 TaxID=3365905 RepID=UPI00381A0F1A